MHTTAWFAWVGLVMTVALATSNPLYLAVVLLSVVLVAVLAPRAQHATAGFRALAVFGGLMLVVSLGIAIVNGSYGDHVLFTIPGPRIPSWLGGLRLGGPVAAEGIVASLSKGLAILCVFLAFAVFNGSVSPHRVLRTTPAALFHAGLVVTVGLTLLPSSIEDVRRLREMRALRGAPSGLRALPGLVVPAVIGGLERSMRLAEAMEARGYASAPPGPRWPRLVGAASAPLLLAAATAWFYYPDLKPLAFALALLALGAIATWVTAAARQRHTTRLYPDPLSATERLFAAGSGALALTTLAASAGGWLRFDYNPFAGLAWPGFELLPGLVAIACGWPALLLAGRPVAVEVEVPARLTTVAPP
jgi:energy-coupling factor transport system permease protein